MDCDIVQKMLLQYRNGTCSPKNRRLVDVHLRTCAHCSQQLQCINKHSPENQPQFIPPVQRKCKQIYIALCILLVFFACILTVLSVFIKTKWGIKNTVLLFEDQITVFAEDELEHSESAALNWLWYRVDVYPDSDCVFFSKTGSFDYEGFFYSSNGEPIGFQGTEMPFLKTDSGWIWKEENGDNWMQVEYISENLYWYQMHF